MAARARWLNLFNAWQVGRPNSRPRSESDLPAFSAKADSFPYDAWHGYWYLEREGTAPAYPFGFGLSYARFSYGAVRLSRKTVAAGGTLTGTVTLRNTSGVAGTEAA